MPDPSTPAPAGLPGPVTDHGGALDRAEARFGRPAGGWLDLSTGINPWPWPWPRPLPAVPDGDWTRLPSAAAEAGLVAALCRFTGQADPATVAPAPGSQALIQLVPRLWPPGRVAIPGPTYAEHARCWRLAGHEVVTVAATDAPGFVAAGAPGVGFVVLVNPNNPDGGCWPPDGLLALAAVLAGRGGALVVDEAFADLVPALSLAAAAGRPGLVVLRSFGKFFGLAGLRLGFALAEPAVARHLTAALGPWAVAGPALTLGRLALEDAAWAAAMRERLAAAAAALDRCLDRCGLPVLGGTSLFRLTACPEASAVAAALARRGILVRAFDAFPDRLRFGLPPDAPALTRLEQGLRVRGR